MSKRCPVCRDAIRPGDNIMTCNLCGAVYHRECWDTMGKCGVYGCSSQFATPSTEAGEAAAAPPAGGAPPDISFEPSAGGAADFFGDPFGIEIVEETAKPAEVHRAPKPANTPPPAPDNAKRFCPKCGVKIVKGSKFCKACGTRIE